MAIIPKGYIEAVVAIGIGSTDDTDWIGTGFLVGRPVDKEKSQVPVLITNRHVLDGKNSIILRLKKKDSEDFITTEAALYEKGSKLYVTHPNKKIDIAALKLNAAFIMENELQYSAFNIDSKENALTSEELRCSGVDEGSLVYMLGFPMGLVNETSTLPICRLGCLARMNAQQIAENNNMLVDIQNFPGNSGSPIVLRPEIVSIEGTDALPRSVLVGIVHSYLPYIENLINSQTKKVVEIKSENSGIANVHPVEYIKETIDLIVEKFNENTSDEESGEE